MNLLNEIIQKKKKKKKKKKNDFIYMFLNELYTIINIVYFMF